MYVPNYEICNLISRHSVEDLVDEKSFFEADLVNNLRVCKEVVDNMLKKNYINIEKAALIRMIEDPITILWVKDGGEYIIAKGHKRLLAFLSLGKKKLRDIHSYIKIEETTSQQQRIKYKFEIDQGIALGEVYSMLENMNIF